MSATIGTRAARTISFNAAVASAVGQDTRTMSAPASSVGVLVMVWTLIGASPPTGTEPTMIWRDLRRSISRHGRMEDMTAHIGAPARAAKPLQMDSRDSYRLVLTGLTESVGAGMPKLAQLARRDDAPRNEAAELRRIPRFQHRFY